MSCGSASSLRERGDDVPQIVDFCLQNLVKQRKARVAKVSPEAMAVLTRHKWPGNVRELENRRFYRSAVIAQGDTILVKDLPAEIRGAVGVEPTVAALGTNSSEAPFDYMRIANAENVALATAKVVAERIAANRQPWRSRWSKPLTLFSTNFPRRVPRRNRESCAR